MDNTIQLPADAEELLSPLKTTIDPQQQELAVAINRIRQSIQKKCDQLDCVDKRKDPIIEYGPLRVISHVTEIEGSSEIGEKTFLQSNYKLSATATRFSLSLKFSKGTLDPLDIKNMTVQLNCYSNGKMKNIQQISFSVLDQSGRSLEVDTDTIVKLLNQISSDLISHNVTHEPNLNKLDRYKLQISSYLDSHPQVLTAYDNTKILVDFIATSALRAILFAGQLFNFFKAVLRSFGAVAILAGSSLIPYAVSQTLDKPNTPTTNVSNIKSNKPIEGLNLE